MTQNEAQESPVVGRQIPWWQKVYCVLFGVMTLWALYETIRSLAAARLVYIHDWIVAAILPLIVYSFLFLVSAARWKKGEPL